MNAPDEYWLPSLNAVRVPDGIDDGAVIDHLLEEYDLGDRVRTGRSGGRYLADRLYGLLGPPEKRRVRPRGAGGRAGPAGF